MFYEVLYSLTLEDEMLRVLGLHIWNQLPETVKANLTFQIYKKGH